MSCSCNGNAPEEDGTDHIVGSAGQDEGGIKGLGGGENLNSEICVCSPQD